MIAAFVPGRDVANVGWYEIKLLGGSPLPLAVGLGFYARARRRARPAGRTGPEL